MILDHVAIGVGDHRDALELLTGRLGGLVISGGAPPGSGFQAMQIRIGRGSNGMTVELLEPADPHLNDFLARFLAAGGDGPHHITFKTKDIEAELERLRSIGTDPVAIDFTDRGWQEMFIHPRDAHGTVIQIAQTDAPVLSMADLLDQLPESLFIYDGRPWWDEPSDAETSEVSLQRLVIETPDRARGDRFYSDVLGSECDVSESHSDHHWDGGTIRLIDADLVRPAVGWFELDGIEIDASIGSARFLGARP